MEEHKYSGICIDYEELLKRDCNNTNGLHPIYCEQIKKLLEECYKFKDKKMNQHK